MGVYGDLIIIPPKPYSIYLRATIRVSEELRDPPTSEATACLRASVLSYYTTDYTHGIMECLVVYPSGQACLMGCMDACN